MMKPATSSRLAKPSIALIMLLLHLTQHVRGFTSVTTHSFNRMPSWLPLTKTKTKPTLTTTRSLPVTSFTPRQYDPTIVSSSSLWYDRTRTTQLFSSKTDESSSRSGSSVVPITVLSGFLGSGKTTCLQHLLTNNEGLKIAVIVNDVASVNIDSKLVRGEIASDGSDTSSSTSSSSSSSSSAQPAGLVQLQNGCACCSISGELLSSVSELLTISDLRADDEKFDHIVIEMSGVAEPRSVRNIFQEAMMYDMPLLERVRLDTLCTVVDCSTYGEYLRSGKLANADESPELFYRDGEEEDDGRRKAQEEEDGDDDRNLFDMLTGGGANAESGYEGGVCDLLVEQTEVADVVLLNKIDILQGKLQDTKDIVTALNPRAKIISTSFGKIERLEDILGITEGEGVAMDGVVDDHKDYVSAADEAEAETGKKCDDADCSDPLHDHDHSHSHSDHSNDAGSMMEDDVGEGGCTDPDCADTSHSHSHSHSSDAEATGCVDPDCTDTSHSHSHSHSSDAEAADCTDLDCTDTSHSHSHSHSSDADAADCTDPDCTDTSHSHSHSHSSSNTASAPLHAGIGSYVYRARRPFHPSRLVSILHKLPVVRGVPTISTNQNVDDTSIHGQDDDDNVNKVFKQVLRSKGFAWTADSNVKALYWSHAGSSFEMQCLGRWWATLPKQQWPEEVKDSILADYDSLDHDETAASPTTSSVGDRRQEVVFIGPGIGSLDSRTVIKSVLDSCLLNDEEWDIFRSKRDDEASLTCFENPLQTRMLTY